MTRTPSSFWTYQASTPTPSVAEAIAAGCVAAATTADEWESLSPGMRRTIVRGAKPKES